MKNLYLLIVIIGIVSKTFGQIESNTKFKAIPALNLPSKPVKEKSLPAKDIPKLNLPEIVTPNLLEETNIFGTKSPVDNSFEMGTSKPEFSMIKKNKFEHTMGDVYKDKMTKDLQKTLNEGNGPLDRKDRDLGQFITTSNSLVVHYRDYIQIDGDLINVYLNDNLIQSRLFLNGTLNQFTIPLFQGINKIEFVVASQGTSGGNTAEIHVIDEFNKKLKEEYWDNLALGTRIKLIVMKE